MSKKLIATLAVVAMMVWIVVANAVRPTTVGRGIPGYHPELMASEPTEGVGDPLPVPEDEPAVVPAATAPTADAYIKYVVVESWYINRDEKTGKETGRWLADRYLITEDEVYEVPGTVPTRYWEEKRESEIVPLPPTWRYWDRAELDRVSQLRPTLPPGTSCRYVDKRNGYMSGTWYLSPQ